MSNAFVTAKLIAERALPLLAERTAMLPLVYRGEWDGTFAKVGDTIQIRKPTRATAIDTSGDISGAISATKDTAVEIQLSNQQGVARALTSKEMTMNVDDMERLVIAPAINAIAEKVNSDILGLYTDIPYFTGTSGSTPDALSDLANVGKVLNVNDAPQMDRALVMDFDALAKYQALDSIVEVDKSGTNAALRQGLLGQIYGMTLAADGQVKTHTAGGYTALADVTIAAGAAGATTISLESAAGASTATLVKGDLLSIDGYQFVVTATTAAAVSGDIAAVSIYPALPMDFDEFTSDDVTFPDVTARAHVANLGFHRDAFALAMAPLEAPMGGADSAVVSYRGLSIRVVMDYAFATDKNQIRFDVLYGVKTLFPELAVRLIG
jgi:hypothetical protein